jgi:branched-chain amino acid transport system substrate-binding protein
MVRTSIGFARRRAEERMMNRKLTGAALAVGLVLTTPCAAQSQQPAAPAQPPIKIGIVTFLTGPAAAPFGIPGRNATEILVESLNAGKLPAPYNQVGLGGGRIEAKYVDESGSTAQQVTEFRNLVQRDKVDVVVGYVSSGNCLAVAPVAEELKALTVIDVCGTPRLLEERPLKYVFRVNPHATMDNVAAARYTVDRKKDIATYSGINQNYAWGQDSWRDFVLAMKTLAPKATVDKELFPKLFAGEFGAEISALLTSRSQIIHSSFYDGDLEAFIFQSTARALPQRMPYVLTTGETALARLGTKFPDGMIIGARGSHGLLARDSEFNRWFQQVYADRFSMAPTYPSYHAAQSLLGLKAAWEKAQARKGGGRPSTEDVIAAFEGLEFSTPSTTIRMAIGSGHQGISDISYGINRFNKAEGRPEIVDVVRYPAECVNPPANVDSQAWLEGGMKGAKCN